MITSSGYQCCVCGEYYQSTIKLGDFYCCYTHRPVYGDTHTTEWWIRARIDTLEKENAELRAQLSARAQPAEAVRVAQAGTTITGVSVFICDDCGNMSCAPGPCIECNKELVLVDFWRSLSAPSPDDYSPGGNWKRVVPENPSPDAPVQVISRVNFDTHETELIVTPATPPVVREAERRVVEEATHLVKLKRERAGQSSAHEKMDWAIWETHCMAVNIAENDMRAAVDALTELELDREGGAG